MDRGLRSNPQTPIPHGCGGVHCLRAPRPAGPGRCVLFGRGCGQPGWGGGILYMDAGRDSTGPSAGEAAVASTLFTLTPMAGTGTDPGSIPGDGRQQRCVLSAAGTAPVPAEGLDITGQDVAIKRDAIRSRSLRHAKNAPVLHATTRSSRIPMRSSAPPSHGPAGSSGTPRTSAPHPVRCSSFLRSLRDENGNLLHRYRDHVSGIPAICR